MNTDIDATYDQTTLGSHVRQDFAPAIVPATPTFGHSFRSDVLDGLSQRAKSVPSKWLYDLRGSELFEEITLLPEYYPTRAEMRILEELASSIEAEARAPHSLIEFGSGSSVKTRLLLREMQGLIRYVPIDISEDFLELSCASLRADFPMLQVHPLAADFVRCPGLPEATHGSPLADAGGNLGFFPGSTIGNFTPEAAVELMRTFGRVLGCESRLLVGVDTTQDVAQLIPAYADAAGVTAEFNLNLLDRINRELGGTFERSGFRHEARYDPCEGRVEMHLLSLRQQQVHVAGRLFSFAAGETIHTENCYKHTPTRFVQLALEAGWLPDRSWRDKEQTGFTIFLLRRLA
jgi:dimethylhistidine N-methyltransferase